MQGFGMSRPDGGVASPVPAESAIQVIPSEFYYYLSDRSENAMRVGRTWDASPVAILAVRNPTDSDVPRVKVRVNHLDFLVRPPRFSLPNRCSFVPLLVRLHPAYDEVKVQLVAQNANEETPNNSFVHPKLVLKRVDGPQSLRAGMTVSMVRRGAVPAFHSKTLTRDEVRLALENTGIKSVAAEFIARGVPFKKLCGLTWGCCLKGRPQPGSLSFQHEASCPIVKHRGLVSLTELGQSRKSCPICEGERGTTRNHPDGLPCVLINIIIQFLDPLM